MPNPTAARSAAEAHLDRSGRPPSSGDVVDRLESGNGASMPGDKVTIEVLTPLTGHPRPDRGTSPTASVAARARPRRPSSLRPLGGAGRDDPAALRSTRPATTHGGSRCRTDGAETSRLVTTPRRPGGPEVAGLRRSRGTAGGSTEARDMLCARLDAARRSGSP